MMDKELLRRAVEAKTEPVYRTTKEELIDYYRDTYGAKWTRRIAEDLYGSIFNRRGEPVSAQSIMRRFQGARLAQQGNQAPYVELGRKLSPVAVRIPGNNLTITVQGRQYDRPGGRERSWTVTFHGADAYAFAANPTYYSFFRALGYPDSVIDQFEDENESSGVEVTNVF